MFTTASMNCNYSTNLLPNLLITIYIADTVISIHVTFLTFRYVFYRLSSFIREELISHNVPDKGLRTINKAKVYTSFLRPEEGVCLIYRCVLYTGNYGIP